MHLSSVLLVSPRKPEDLYRIICCIKIALRDVFKRQTESTQYWLLVKHTMTFMSNIRIIENVEHGSETLFYFHPKATFVSIITLTLG